MHQITRTSVYTKTCDLINWLEIVASFELFHEYFHMYIVDEGGPIDIVSSQLYVCHILVSKKCQLQAGTIHPILGKRAANTTADRQQYTNTSKVCDDTMSMGRATAEKQLSLRRTVTGGSRDMYNSFK